MAKDKFTKTHFRQALETLGISITQAGEVLGLSERQGWRYAEGTTKVPGPLKKLLRLAIAKKIKPDDLRAL